jgi:hypothetical protein
LIAAFLVLFAGIEVLQAARHPNLGKVERLLIWRVILGTISDSDGGALHAILDR